MRSLKFKILKKIISCRSIQNYKKNEILTISIALLVREIFGAQGVKTPNFLMKNVNMKIRCFNKYFTLYRYLMIISIVIIFLLLKSFLIKSITKNMHII